MNDPIALLKRDHREVAGMLKELANTRPGPKRKRMTDKVAKELQLHMQIEESLLYPIVAERVSEEEEREAEVEHKLAREGVDKLVQLVDDVGFGAAVDMVTAGIKHHVKEEEGEVFPKLKKDLDRDELARLGDAVVAAKKRR